MVDKEVTDSSIRGWLSGKFSKKLRDIKKITQIILFLVSEKLRLI